MSDWKKRNEDWRDEDELEDVYKRQHIVIGSLRVRTGERQPFRDKPCDWEAGKKHRCTSAMLRHLRVAVMEMCEMCIRDRC